MGEENYKTVKQVFQDYHCIWQELAEAKIKSINLFKKTNFISIVLITKERISIRQVESFEQYIQARFGIKTVEIKIEKEQTKKENQEETEQSEEQNQENELEQIKKENQEKAKPCETIDQEEVAKIIEKEWIDIIEYITRKHPVTKAILRDSRISVEANAINVLLSSKGKEFLIANRLDEVLSNLLSNVYGKKSKVTFIENFSEEENRRREELFIEKQNQAILEAQKQIEIERQENKTKKENIENKEIKESDNIQPVPPFSDDDAPIGEEEYLQELEKMEEEENVILGKITKAKENKVKIQDISADNKRITIEGRLVNCVARETKTGKGMLIYELYDGSGIITCKSFTKNIGEGNEVVDKMKKASGIKTTGKAGLDTFAGDVTLITNIIIEVNGDDFPKLPTEDENSPLILGMNTQIKEPLVKIQDLTVDSGNVCIDGEVINTGKRNKRWKSNS